MDNTGKKEGKNKFAIFSRINKKGYIYTLSAIILLLILIFFILFISRFAETEIEDSTGKIRCDELHFLVEDVKVDLQRGAEIAGRRAAIYTLDMVSYTGENLSDFNITLWGEQYNGSMAAIAELIFNGTLGGENSSYMQGHTLSDWLDKLNQKGDDLNFNINLTVEKIEIMPYDAWNFIIYIDLTFNVSDASDMCFYELSNVSTFAISSIEGLEDPMYPTNTGGRAIKYMDHCDPGSYFYNAADGTDGWNWASGNPVFALNESEFGIVIPGNSDDDNILIIPCINYSNPVISGCVPYGTYKEYMEDYAGIITLSNDSDTINGLKNIGVPYLAGVTSNLTALNISENDTIVLDASQFYFVNLDYFGTNTTCNSKGIWWNENESSPSSIGTQTGWFSELNQTDTSTDYNDSAKFLFPTFDDGTKLCEVAPQLEPNNTWRYNLSYPLKSKNLHLIGSSYDRGNYNVTIYYDDNSTHSVTFTLCDRCEVDDGGCGDDGIGYKSHYVSKSDNISDPLRYVFENVFWDVSEGTWCGGDIGITVQHITVPLNANKYVGGMEIIDTDNSTGSPRPAIWAVTLETAPRNVWVINSSIGNNSFFECYRESSVCPSFFDRLEGRYNLSDKYRNMAPEGVNIGLESFVDINRLYQHNVDIYLNRTALDCLYFEGKTRGYGLKGLDEFGLDYFRIHESYLYDATGDYEMGNLSYDLILWETVNMTS
ncbi:MAG: hypothetical protein A7316_09270 [Candidatus Altiarchaeales archaeon WOR_SM1_86-2]|nr:MAG: hypothetical protein A7316_09270 [Candidatus Altiarchaeales archaeon WOR_SM1_86-2]